MRSQSNAFGIIERMKGPKWKWGKHIVRRLDNIWSTYTHQLNPRDVKRLQLRSCDEIRKVARIEQTL